MTTRTITNFEADYNTAVKSHLQRLGISPKISLRENIAAYYDYSIRAIRPAEREVCKSKEFLCPRKFSSALKRIERIIRSGGDLKAYQSRKLFQSQSNDALLFDWGIQHLHLGTRIESDGFIKRTGPVLFVRFTNTEAYLIIIGKHGEWANQDLLRILHNNWPDSIRQFRDLDALSLEFEPTTEDIKRFRAAGINTPVKVGNAFYSAIGGGYSSTGKSIKAEKKATQEYYSIIEMEETTHANADKWIEALEQAGHVLPPILHLRLSVQASGECLAVCVYEGRSINLLIRKALVRIRHSSGKPESTKPT